MERQCVSWYKLALSSGVRYRLQRDLDRSRRHKDRSREVKLRLLLSDPASLDYWLQLRSVIRARFSHSSMIVMSTMTFLILVLGVLLVSVVFLYKLRFVTSAVLMFIDVSFLILLLGSFLYLIAAINNKLKDDACDLLTELYSDLSASSDRRFVDRVKSSIDALRIDPCIALFGVTITYALLSRVGSILVPIAISLAGRLSTQN